MRDNKRIKLKCCCGAEALFEDYEGSYIDPDGRPDEKGRRFLIEAQADDWLDRHQQCHAATHALPPDGNDTEGGE